MQVNKGEQAFRNRSSLPLCAPPQISSAVFGWTSGWWPWRALCSRGAGLCRSI